MISTSPNVGAPLLSTKKRGSILQAPYDIQIPDLTPATKKNQKPRRLISPMTLLNDHAVVAKEKNVFKGLKGDKLIMQKHHYNIDKIIAEI